jgi:uncharacterized damage-inducible protein DinB
MSISVAAARQHFDYTVWATARLLDAAAKLTPEELNRNFLTADRSVLGTLAHIFGADRLWLKRVQGSPASGFLNDDEGDLPFLQTAFPELHGRWIDRASALTPELLAAEIAYSDQKGNQWKQPLWEIVLHLVNHATHHRGQVSGFLRAMGHIPPSIDFSHYCRRES